jgi:hypothetical protein
MPKYYLPEKAQHDDLGPETAEVDVRDDYSYPDEYARQITVPVNKAILGALQVGEGAKVVLRGNVQELTDNQSATGAGRTTLVLAIDEVDAESEEMEDPDEAFMSGFGNKRGNIGRGGMY